MAKITSASTLRDFYAADGSTTSFTLPIPSEHINQVLMVAGGTSVSAGSYDSTDGSASGSSVQFSGKYGAPAQTFSFETAPAKGSFILVEYFATGAL